MIKKGDTVKVHYTGKFEDGTVFDSSEGRDPLIVKAGEGQVIKGFDDALIGMKKGEKKTVTIPAKEAYGDKNPQLQQKVPRKTFPENITPEKGMVLGLQHPQTGQQFPATVVDVNDDEVILDLNHPLAGKTLVFDIEIVAIE